MTAPHESPPAPADHRRRRRNVVLTGFMGTGKTTVGRLLAHRLCYEFVDTDAIVELRHGPIPTIFAEQGEQVFRDIERQVASELGERDGLVISTGGRMLLDPVNRQSLQRNGDVFCLSASVDEILRRVGHTAHERPLLSGPDPRRRIEVLLTERRPGYAAFEQIETDGREPADLAAEIADILASRDGQA